MKPITILGLNAVWQKVIPLEGLIPGQVHRTQLSSSFFSGKGGNVAIALERLGYEGIELIQALGGEPGAWVIEDMKRFKLNSSPQWIDESTRICTTLIESGGRTTELIEPSPTMKNAEWEQLAQTVTRSLEEKRDILLCGSFPDGDPSPLVEALSKRSSGSELWVDGLREEILKLSPDVLKINKKELASLAKIHGSIVENSEEVSKKYEIPVLIITDELNPVSFWAKDQQFEVAVPLIEKVINTTGAGDTFFAGLVYGRHSGMSWEDSIAHGIEWAGVRCGLPNVEDLPQKNP